MSRLPHTAPTSQCSCFSPELSLLESIVVVELDVPANGQTDRHASKQGERKRRRRTGAKGRGINLDDGFEGDDEGVRVFRLITIISFCYQPLGTLQSTGSHCILA